MAVATTALLTLAELKTLLGLPASPSDQDARYEALINAVSVWIENYTGRYFVIREDYVEYHEAPPMGGWPAGVRLGWARGNTLFLRRYPVVSLTSIDDTGSSGIPITEIDVRPEVGELYRSGGWFQPRDAFGTPSRWAITYDVGFFSSTTDVSTDLKSAAAMMVAMRASTGAFGGGFVLGPIASKTMGRVSVSFGGAGSMGEGAIAQGIPDEIAQILGPWMSRDV